MEPVNAFPYFKKIQLDNPAWILDNKRNGYYIATGQLLSLSKKTQHSKHQSTSVDTEGDFAAAWLEHGASPKDGSYEYAILVGADLGRIEAFCKRMQASETAAYTVLRKDHSAHIVQDKETGTIGFALFEASDYIDTGHVAAVDTPSMVMIREAGNRLFVSAVDPDLRLYEGIEPDQYDEHGRQKEVSVYSRKWVHAESIPRIMHLTLRGSWVLADDEEHVRVMPSDVMLTLVEPACQNERDAIYTVIEITCKDAIPREFVLVRAD
ncbi:Chondroitin sulfate ABC exolyase precursor [compost metagenome]